MSFSRAALAALLWSSAAIVMTTSPVRADVVGVVRGILTGPDGKPIPKVTISLTAPGVALSAVTGADGRFAFPRVPFGHVTLHADTSEGPADAAVDVSTNTVVEVSLLAARVIGTAKATSTGVHGTPVAENTITAAQIATLPANTTVNRVIETLPGVVRFSYDEPVVDGFHGVTYELDGAPLPSSTSSNFANLIDPRQVGAIEVFTGAFPAEFGGQRMGAVVNVQSLSFANPPPPGFISLGGGELGTQEAQLVKQFDIGKAQISLAVDNLAGDRGLDTPSANAIHDASSTTNQFLRIGYPLSVNDSLALDLANQYSTYQIPINTNPNDLNAGQVSLPNQDDVQREYDRFLALSYTHNDADGNGYFRIVPWTRYNRVVYDGDWPPTSRLRARHAANARRAARSPSTSTTVRPTGCSRTAPPPTSGLRATAGRTIGQNTLTYGVDLQQEDFDSHVTIAFAPGESAYTLYPVSNAQRGTNTGVYVEDVWAPNPYLAIKPGLRYDHSTGYVSGEQFSPRFEIDQQIVPATVAHVFIGRYYAAPGLEDTRQEAVITNTYTDRDTGVRSPTRTRHAARSRALARFRSGSPARGSTRTTAPSSTSSTPRTS
jgi:outer membrane receptor protein involved in Fe transport